MKKFKKSFLFFCFVFFYMYSIHTFSQKKIDSLKYCYKIIDSAKKYHIKTLLLHGYNKKSSIYYDLKKYDSAIATAKLLLKHSILLKKDSMVGVSYGKLATYYRLADSLLPSYKYYKKYYKISRANKDTLAQIKALRYIAIFEKNLGLTYDSENTATKALKLVEKLEPNKKQIKAKMAIYNHLGILYREREDYDKAIELYKRALAKVKSSKNRNIILNNIANVYSEQGKHSEAIKSYSKIYNRIRNTEDTLAIAKGLSNLGLEQSKNNNPKGLENIKKALKMRLDVKKKNPIYHSYMHLAEYYTDRYDREMVTVYVDKAYALAKELKNNKFKKDALSFSIAVHNDKKVVEYKKINDSLAAVERANTNKFAIRKYDYLKYQKELQNSKLKQIQERFYKLLYLAIGTSLFVLLIFTIITLNRKNRKDKQQQVYETETRISQKVHDEVANDVFGIMTKLQVKEHENVEILDDLERVYFKTRDISKENSIINFKEDFGIILQDLLVSYGDNQVNVITRNLNKIDWQTLSKLKKTVIYRVLQELMTNMKKHSKASITIVSFSKKNKSIYINYKDNGIGCAIKKNVGLQIAETRIKSINGTITFESQTNKGFEVKIKV